MGEDSTIISPEQKGEVDATTSPSRPKSKSFLRNPFSSSSGPAEAATPTAIEDDGRKATETEPEEPTPSSSATSSPSPPAEINFFGGSVTLSSLPEAHQQAFHEMQQKIAEVAAEDNCAPFNEPDLLNRILIARNYQVPEAFKMWHSIVAWRKSYRPEAMTTEEAEPYLFKGSLINCGPDKKGRPVVYVAGKNHLIDAVNHDRNLRTIVWNLENIVNKSSQTSDGYMALIIDQEGVGRKNMDTHMFIGKPGLVQILQEFYPERLGGAYILHASWIFRAMWVIISPFLDEKTRSKVHVLPKTQDLLEHFDPATLPAEIQAKLAAQNT